MPSNEADDTKALVELNALVAKVKAAQKLYSTYSQEQVDAIFRAAALAAADARIPLAKMAATESGMGVMEDKTIKNHFASEYIYNKYKDDKTCGIVEVDDEFGTITIAEPIGILCGIVPVRIPTHVSSRRYLQFKNFTKLTRITSVNTLSTVHKPNLHCYLQSFDFAQNEERYW